MGRLSGGCREAVWGSGTAVLRLWGGCREGLGRLFAVCGETIWGGRCLMEIIWRVGRLSGRSEEDIWRVCGGRKDRQ